MATKAYALAWAMVSTEMGMWGRNVDSLITNDDIAKAKLLLSQHDQNVNQALQFWNESRS